MFKHEFNVYIYEFDKVIYFESKTKIENVFCGFS